LIALWLRRAAIRSKTTGASGPSGLTRSRALGWRAVVAAHEAAWTERWKASDVVIEGDDEAQRALRFTLYHLTRAANPDDERVSVGALGLTGDVWRCVFRPRILGY